MRIMSRRAFFPKIRHILYLALFLPLLCSCGGGAGTCAVEGKPLVMHHSSLLSITDCDGYAVADVKNPWGSGLLARYLLVPKGGDLPDEMPAGVVIRTPLERTVLFSGVHATLFEELGVVSSVAGVCDARYIYSKGVSDGIAAGTVTDCGSSLNVNAEKVMQVSPDAIFVLPYENGGYGKLETLPFPLVECADYMEASPLGCAEWIRFYGRLVGRAAESDSIFDAVCREYMSLCAAGGEQASRMKLMCELKSSSAWYVPAGGSTMGRLYRDAGADYLFSSLGGSGSVPLSFEKVLSIASDADVWLFKYNSPVDMTYASLLADYAGYAHFRPFRERNVYACNTHRRNLFEQAAFHPERLLRELVALLNPSLVPGYEFLYYEKLREK